MITTASYTILESHRRRVSTIEFWDNSIVYMKLDDNETIELEDSKVHFDFLLSKFDGKNKHRILVEPGRYTEISKEAREYSSHVDSNAMTLGTAVIVRTLAHRIMINFIINFTRQASMKMRMFDNRDNAIEWLINLKQE